MSGKSCPLGHECHKCLWMTKLRGMNPQTGQEMDSEGCAIAFLPILLIENSQQQRQTAAAVESFRNQMMQGNDQMLGVMHRAIEDRRTN
jgi:hypothetical protein